MQGQELATGSPEDVGFDPEHFKVIDDVINGALARGTFPGAVVLVARNGKVVRHTDYGMAMETPQPREMAPSTLFDLASLTKVIVTVPLSLMLVERGLWQLNDPIDRFLPQFEGGGKPQITLWHLLTHTSGLPAWANLFYRGPGRDQAYSELFTDNWPVTSLLHRPGERVIYSDLGYILLGKAIEAVSGKTLDIIADEWIFTPLGMSDTMFNPPEALEARIAATEEDPDRGGVLVGVVHDENAWAMGGVAGHAGLFSTTWDLARFAHMLLNRGYANGRRILSPSAIDLMTSPQTEGLNERRGLGWMIQGPGTSAAGDLMSSRAFGHTGFTGTSVWIDPVYELIVVLLTNRVHPQRERGQEEIQRVRALVHNGVVAAIADE